MIRIIAMIPARMGSQRLKRKNLQLLHGEPLIVHAIRKCGKAGCFDEIWVNSESDEIGAIAEKEGVEYHKRPAELANSVATSEQFVYEFLTKHPCDYVVQVHSIAPLLTAHDVEQFVSHLHREEPDVMLSAVEEQIECALAGVPINFTFDRKQNSQDLKPVQRITWSITAWKSDLYRREYEAGRLATYSGNLHIFPVSPLAGHVIKTQRDLEIAEALWSLA